jgi:sodium-dependent phosphate cotransporter
MWSMVCLNNRILPNNTQEIDISKNMQEIHISENKKEINVSENIQEIDISENKKETDISENIQEIDISENKKETDISENIQEDIWTSRINIVLNILGIFITLYGFLFSLGLMGDSFKILGGKTAGELFQNISNPISGIMVGILATVLVQSSSTSTSVVVGMVSADIITVQTAIPIIMGANIGTSVTNSIVAIGQMRDTDQREKAFSGAVVHDFFNILCVLLFLPLECITHFIYYWSKFLTTHMDGYEGGTFKSPLKFIVSPLIKLIIQVDKKKIKKISQNEMTSDE